MSKNVLSALLLAGAVLSAAPEAPAQSKAPKLDILTELIVGEVSKDDDPYGGWLGVHVRLGPGWKIYWKSPGDAGLPPEVDWSASSNLAIAQVDWPAPHRASILGVESIGYTGEVLFPVKIQITDPDFDTAIELKLALYACSTICVREERTLKATLSHPSSPDAQGLIDEWRDRVPAERSASLTITSMELIRSTPPRVRVEATSTVPLEHPDLFVASTPPAVYADKPDVEIFDGNRAVLTATLQSEPDAPQDLRIAVTLVDGARAIEAVAASAEPPPMSGGAGTLDRRTASDGPALWWSILLTAWLGGLVLNFMPCVFPVLSLKLLGFIDHDASDLRKLRTGFVASASGVIVSFLVLASALVAIKAAGGTIGWGIQFQHPVFLAVMAIVIALFAANLLGLFDVSLPWWLTSSLARRGAGSSVPSHFASGFVATLLATPCSAPFVGTAVGYALSRGSLEIYGVFGALGVGMATPYLVVACVPGLASKLPRPGRWMLWLKRAMALPLLATSAWLITLVDATAGLAPASIVATGLAGGLAILWWRRTEPLAGSAIAVSSALAIASAGVVVVIASATDSATTELRSVEWRRFGELDGLVRSGHTVFLDITADWCVTCKVNKALVVNDPAISRRLSSDVIPVRGDWTRPDPRIAEYLKSFGRYGLPFNVVFGPAAPHGLFLPELLTTNAVLSAFAKSSGNIPPTIKAK